MRSDISSESDSSEFSDGFDSKTLYLQKLSSNYWPSSCSSHLVLAAGSTACI